MAAGFRSWIFAPFLGWPFATGEGGTTIGEPSVPVVGTSINRNGPVLARTLHRCPNVAVSVRIGPGGASPTRPA